MGETKKEHFLHSESVEGGRERRSDKDREREKEARPDGMPC